MATFYYAGANKMFYIHINKKLWNIQGSVHVTQTTMSANFL